jgi:transposase-like protein
VTHPQIQRRYTRPCACGCGNNVLGRAYRSQLPRYIPKHAPHRSAWSEDEKKFVVDNYDRLTSSEIAKHLGRSHESVKSYALKQLRVRKGGLHRSLVAKFERGTPLRPADACWEWMGNVDDAGYGVITHGADRWLAHRLSVYLRDGRLSRTLDVLHTCDNKPCVNPNHLYVGGDCENQRDRAARRLGGANQKLDPEKARVIRADFAAGATKRELAARYGVHVSCIHACVIRKSWGWIDEARPA